MKELLNLGYECSCDHNYDYYELGADRGDYVFSNEENIIIISKKYKTVECLDAQNPDLHGALSFQEIDAIKAFIDDSFFFGNWRKS